MTTIKVKRSSTATDPGATLNFGEFALISSGTSPSITNSLYIGQNDDTPYLLNSSGTTYSAGSGLQLSSTTFSIKPDVTTGANNFPLTSVSNGASIQIDNSSIVANGSSQISVGLVDGGTF